MPDQRGRMWWNAAHARIDAHRNAIAPTTTSRVITRSPSHHGISPPHVSVRTAANTKALSAIPSNSCPSGVIAWNRRAM